MTCAHGDESVWACHGLGRGGEPKVRYGPFVTTPREEAERAIAKQSFPRPEPA